MIKSLILSSLIIVQSAFAKTSFGPCPQVQLFGNLDPAQYAGDWYEIYRDKDTTFEAGTDCCRVKYTKISQNQLSVYNRATYSDGRINDINGRATCNGSRCKVKFDWYIPTGPYNVVDTDYTSYAIVYSCTNFIFGLFKSENLWILSRQTTLATEDDRKTTITNRISSYNVATDLYKPTQGGSCSYGF
ncbi:apolipoprotein d [Stylonychia lemnae]|uniref:Apolipoprotein d n=1 Tax=Stylonychia lemnae TaxID=5949 RepID=A0A078AFW1_STYLE|nr:apolipoprotein d [Stylonychia lemnae]|eukprot:CDW81114.1 apolipoprotein d [Stylonychia lemnae]